MLLAIDPALGRRAGLEQALRESIRNGQLPAGSVMPSSRAFAQDLGYSRSTIVAAYEQLVAEGYLVSSQGKPTRVAEIHRPVNETRRSRTYEDPDFAADFRPGEPDTSLFPRSAWLRSIKHVLATAPDDIFGYPDPQGMPELRRVLAEYLARSRAVHVSPDAISVFGGFGSALGFVAEMLVKRSITTVAVENPSLFVYRDILRLGGVDLVPVPVDEDGISVAALDRTAAGAVLVTPAHQFPLGVTMSSVRRAELLDWANTREAWIIEDDYDGEFRFDRQPIGSLQGLDPDRVIYCGTASKSLAPGLRAGWMVIPQGLRREVATVKHIRAGLSSIEQLTLANFITQGEFDRHVRSTRAIYRARKQELSFRLEHDVPWLRVPDRDAGLHLTCSIEGEVDEQATVSRAADEGIGFFGLGPHWFRESKGSGLVLGFSRPPQHRFDLALDQLITFLGTQ